MEDYRLKIESLTISLAYDMGVMISEAKKEARTQERNKVIEEIESLLDKRSFEQVIGSRSYRVIDVDEVIEKLNQLKGKL